MLPNNNNNNNVGWIKHLDFIILDIICAETAYLLAFFTRHGLTGKFPEIYPSGAILLAFTIMLFSIFTDNHKNILKRGNVKEIKSVVSLSLASFAVITVFFVFMHEAGNVSRITMGLWYPYSMILMMLIRSLWKLYLKNRNVGAQEKQKILLISDKKHAKQLIENVESRSYGTVEIIGLVLADRSGKVGRSVNGVEIVSTLEDSVAYLQDKWVDEIFISVDDDIEIPDMIKEKYLLMGLVVKQTLNLTDNPGSVKVVERRGRLSEN